MSTVALRVPVALAEALADDGMLQESRARSLPPEILDAAIVVEGLAGVVVVVSATLAARRRIAGWLRDRSLEVPVRVHVSTTETIEISGGDPEAVAQVVQRLFGGPEP